MFPKVVKHMKETDHIYFLEGGGAIPYRRHVTRVLRLSPQSSLSCLLTVKWNRVKEKKRERERGELAWRTDQAADT